MTKLSLCRTRTITVILLSAATRRKSQPNASLESQLIGAWKYIGKRVDAIIRAVFKDNLCYGGGIFRTPYTDPTFKDKILILKKKGLLVREQSFKISEDNPLCTPEGTRTPDPRFRKPTLYPAELPRHFPLRSGKDSR